MATAESESNQNVTVQRQEEIDDDDVQAHQAHRIVPTPVGTTTSEGDGVTNEPSGTQIKPSKSSTFDVENLIKTDFKKYINTPVPKDHPDFVKCHLNRVKQGITHGFESIFKLKIHDTNENNQTTRLVARKHITIGGHAEYYIGIDPEQDIQSINNENSLATLRGFNILGTEYLFYDHQNSSTNQGHNQESIAIAYDDHIFEINKIRKFTVVLLNLGEKFTPTKDKETILDAWRSGHLKNFQEMHNILPLFDEQKKQYGLKFLENRVQQPSHKNFLLAKSNEDNEDNIIMQFGRIDDSNFALDYRHPLTAMQAFAIALSSFHTRFHS